jgi:hypothetical protein
VRTSSTDLEVLIGTLQVAEAQLRWLMAESLSPGVQYRIEARATLASHAALQAIRVERRVELKPGWAELVEVDESIDALLERLIRMEGASEIASARPSVHAVPPLPADLDAVATPPVPGERSLAAPPPASRSERAPVAAEASAQAAASDASESAAFGDGAVAFAAATAPQPAATFYTEDDEGAYAEGGGDYGDEEAWNNAWQADSAYEGWSDDPVAGAAAASDFASDGTEAPSNPLDDGRGFTGSGELGFDPGETVVATEAGMEDAGRVDAYAARRDGGARIGMDELGLEDGLSATRPRSEEDMLDDLIERTHAELTLDLPRGAFDEDDEEAGEVTQVVERRRPASAALQLQPDGTAKLVDGPATDDDDDDDASASAIALADASAWGEEEPSGTPGSLSVARSEEDEPDIISVSVEALSEPTPAPTMTAEEVRDLLVDAERAAGRDVLSAVLLYSDVLDAETDNLEARLSRGRLYMDLADYTRAASDFLKAETRAPEDAEVQVALGDLFFARKEYGRATAYFDAAIRLDGGHARAWYRRGLSRYYRKEFATAVEDLERAKRLDPLLPSLDTFLDRARRRQL